jgi:hypothetical protein
MLLTADLAGSVWTAEKIAELFESRARTFEKLCERFDVEGVEQTRQGKQHEQPATGKPLGR